MNEELKVAITAEIKDLEAKLKEANNKLKAFGAETEQIGTNTKKGFNGLSNSINQLTREVPAFTYSAQTGFLALSNNIPILVDQIQMLRAANLELAASGKPTTSVFKQIVSSLFSFQTALLVGVSLVVIYGKEIGDLFSKIANGSKSIDEAEVKLTALNEAFESKSVANAIKDMVMLSTYIEQAKKGIISKQQAVDQYNKTIGTLTGEVKTLNEAEQGFINNTSRYVNALIEREAANIIAKEAAETLIKLNEATAKSYEDYISTTSTLSNTFYKDAKDNSANLVALREEENRRIVEDAKNKQAAEIKLLQENYQKQLDLVKKFSPLIAKEEEKTKGGILGAEQDRSGTKGVDLQGMGTLEEVYSGLAAQRTAEFNEQVQRLTKSVEELKITYGGGFIPDDELERMSQLKLLLTDIGTSISLGIGQAFADAIVSGQDFGKAMLNVLKQLITRLLAAIAATATLAVLMTIATGGLNLSGVAANFGKASAILGTNLGSLGGIGGRSASVAGVPAPSQGSVSFEIRGDKLYGVLQNYNERLDRLT